MTSSTIRRQALANIIPAIVVEIMLLIYNLADTFFIARTGDPLQLAAVSIAAPVFMVLIALGIIFMVGAMSFISRTLGSGQVDRANAIASFCVWGSIAGKHRRRGSNGRDLHVLHREHTSRNRSKPRNLRTGLQLLVDSSCVNTVYPVLYGQRRNNARRGPCFGSNDGPDFRQYA